MQTQKPLQRGISLIEVLAAIFVVSVGLLGVLAVIPFGAFQVSKARQTEYAANMLANAIEEIVIRELIKPTSWGVASLSGGDGTPLLQSVDVRLEVTKTVTEIVRESPADPPYDVEYKIMYERTSNVILLNGTKFLWVEPSATKDPAHHIFCIGSTFESAWMELMRGQDDLVYTTYEDKRPDFKGEKDKIQSSGKYTWFFTFLPNSMRIADPASVPRNVEVVLETNPTIPRSNIPPFPPIILGGWIPVTSVAYTTPLMKEWDSEPPTSVQPKDLAYPTIARYYFANVVSPTVPVDVLACYNRVASDDRQVECQFTPSLGGGTLTSPFLAEHLELLSQTKYVFVTWGPPEQVAGGAWCKIVFLDKSNPANPTMIVTGELSDAPGDVQVYVPSGVLYHKRVGNVEMR